MKNYIVTKTFKGSKTGSDVTIFEKGEIVDETILGEDLLNVAKVEKWIKATSKKQSTIPDTVANPAIVAAIAVLDLEDKGNLTSSGAPTTEALEIATGEKVTAAERDTAWAAFNQE